ncbi:hypothetical protein [Reichenbachiella sp.]|uniref:hypothetical protein n=1 Tax=Reichenbachiella sp. TaxID=2184521 RepID=UPI00329860EE
MNRIHQILDFSQECGGRARLGTADSKIGKIGEWGKELKSLFQVIKPQERKKIGSQLGISMCIRAKLQIAHKSTEY